MKFSTGNINYNMRVFMYERSFFVVAFHNFVHSTLPFHNRSFDCMRIGDKGVKIVRPDDPDFLQKPGTDAEIDAGGYDDVEDYDENAVVRRRRRRKTT